ncbi:MAG: LuxR C-terminal-related transcriptional regulator [Tannerellaceae bacterium]|jgi:DNA-binding CsgD family transcriptional regulator|nr:LuxR C-terminal-related transcriptional regulator [Tannerellaceae bacterium]
MRKTKRIAVILADTLQTTGLQSLLADYFPPVEIVSFPSFGHFMEIGGDFNYFFTHADTFILNADFFLPRRTRTVVLTADRTEAPAAGYNCISACASGEIIIEQLQQFFSVEENNDTSSERSKELSARETDVLKLVVQGSINKDIADKLNISLNTVLTHRKNITAKLGIKTVAGLTFYAIMNGLISSDLMG